MAGMTTGSHPQTHAGWWLPGATLVALTALLAWTAWQNAALRERLTALEQENRSLRQAPPVPATVTAPPAVPVPLASVAAGLPPTAPPPAAVADPLAAYAKPPASSPRSQGPLEAALQRLSEPAASPGASPFGRP